MQRPNRMADFLTNRFAQNEYDIRFESRIGMLYPEPVFIPENNDVSPEDEMKHSVSWSESNKLILILLNVEN